MQIYPEHLLNLKGSKLEEFLKNRSVAVMGLGQSGLSVVRLLKRLKSKIFVSES